MAVADFGNNNIAGQLPGSWGQWTSLRGLRVTANFLKGPLPAEWGSWSVIEQLQLGMVRVVRYSDCFCRAVFPVRH